MSRQPIKQIRRQRRKKSVRKTVLGTPLRPRLSVYRSLKHIYAQVIDDLSGRTVASASSVAAKISEGGNKAAGTEVGKSLAERAVAAGVSEVVFDRNGCRYHGRVKAVADAAREGGLKF